MPSAPSTDPDPCGGGPGNQEKVHGCGSQRKRRKNKMASKTGFEEGVPELKVGGCLRCHQDSDYAQVSVWEGCDHICLVWMGRWMCGSGVTMLYVQFLYFWACVV